MSKATAFMAFPVEPASGPKWDCRSTAPASFRVGFNEAGPEAGGECIAVAPVWYSLGDSLPVHAVKVSFKVFDSEKLSKYCNRIS